LNLQSRAALRGFLHFSNPPWHRWISGRPNPRHHLARPAFDRPLPATAGGGLSAVGSCHGDAANTQGAARAGDLWHLFRGVAGRQACLWAAVGTRAVPSGKGAPAQASGISMLHWLSTCTAC